MNWNRIINLFTFVVCALAAILYANNGDSIAALLWLVILQLTRIYDELVNK
jgi:hypothetical protein